MGIQLRTSQVRSLVLPEGFAQMITASLIATAIVCVAIHKSGVPEQRLQELEMMTFGQWQRKHNIYVG